MMPSYQNIHVYPEMKIYGPNMFQLMTWGTVSSLRLSFERRKQQKRNWKRRRGSSNGAKKYTWIRCGFFCMDWTTKQIMIKATRERVNCTPKSTRLVHDNALASNVSKCLSKPLTPADCCGVCAGRRVCEELKNEFTVKWNIVGDRLSVMFVCVCVCDETNGLSFLDTCVRTHTYPRITS